MADPIFPSMPDRVRALRAVLVITLCAPVVAWWAIGDQQDPYASEAVQPHLPPPPLGTGDDRVLGLFALVVGVGAVAVLVWLSVRERLDESWWGIVVGTAIVGTCVAWSYRVLSIRVDDGDLGGGFALLLVLPFCLALSVALCVKAIRIHRRDVPKRRTTTGASRR